MCDVRVCHVPMFQCACHTCTCTCTCTCGGNLLSCNIRQWHSVARPATNTQTQIMCSMCMIVCSFVASITSNKRIFGMCGKTSTKARCCFLFCLVVATVFFFFVPFVSFNCFVLVFHVLLIVLVCTWNQQLSFSTKGCVFVCCSQFARCSHFGAIVPLYYSNGACLLM